MKRFTILGLILLSVISSFSQVINVNPDPNGEPWLLGGWREPTKTEIAQIPDLQINEVKSTKDLPTSLDNSTLPYFRPVFNQTDGCCAQASGIGYNFTYEINRANGTTANVAENQFPTHYTYNFLNGGSGANGSFYSDGWNIIAANGCPTVEQYGGMAQEATYWMTGYDLYKNSMLNRVTEIFKIHIENEADLLKLKTWMFNHGENSPVGGIVNFSAGISTGDYNMTGDYIISSWGEPVNHAMTFVGWNDSIGYDYNNDGQITNDIDITGDGIVDMRDWEQGVMIMVNSWSTYWGDNGKAYVPYRLLALPTSEGGIGAGNYVYSIKVNPSFEKQLFMKFEIGHNSRNKIKITAGVATSTTADYPQFTMNFPLFNFQGGDYDMGGYYNSSPIDVSLDITPLLSYVESGVDAKFFLIVEESDPSGSYSGMVYNYSIVDNLGTEYTSNQTNVSITNNAKTYLSVIAAPSFDSPSIIDDSLGFGVKGQYYTHSFSATGGGAPLVWSVYRPISESNITETYPSITSNQITVSDNDDGYGMQPIDFDFPFYGENFDTLYVRTDGSITFLPGFDYVRTESAIIANKIISVFASDLMIYPANGDGIFYEGDSTHATFRWKTALWGDETANVDVAVTLYPDGKIKFYYGSGITEGLSWASGISAGDNSNYFLTSVSGNNNPSDVQIKLIPSAFPDGMFFLDDGTFYGTPTEIGNWDITFQVRDSRNITKSKTLNFRVANTEFFVAEINKNIAIYPSPASSIVHIITNEKIVNVKLINSNGQLIKTDMTDNKTLNVANIPNGIYILIINTEQNSYSKKIVVKK